MLSTLKNYQAEQQIKGAAEIQGKSPDSYTVQDLINAKENQIRKAVGERTYSYLKLKSTSDDDLRPWHALKKEN